jgi:hypothetical protein
MKNLIELPCVELGRNVTAEKSYAWIFNTEKLLVAPFIAHQQKVLQKSSILHPTTQGTITNVKAVLVTGKVERAL